MQFQKGFQGEFSAIFLEESVVHVDIEGIGDEEALVMICVASGEHGAELFCDVARGDEHAHEAHAGGVEGLLARRGSVAVGDFIAELEDEDVGVFTGFGGALGDTGKVVLRLAFEDVGGGVEVRHQAVEGIRGGDGHEGVFPGIAGGLRAAQGVDSDGAYVVGDLGVFGAASDAFHEEGFAVEEDLAVADFDEGGGDEEGLRIADCGFRIDGGRYRAGGGGVDVEGEGADAGF